MPSLSTAIFCGQNMCVAESMEPIAALRTHMCVVESRKPWQLQLREKISAVRTCVLQKAWNPLQLCVRTHMRVAQSRKPWQSQPCDRACVLQSRDLKLSPAFCMLSVPEFSCCCCEHTHMGVMQKAGGSGSAEHLAADEFGESLTATNCFCANKHV